MRVEMALGLRLNKLRFNITKKGMIELFGEDLEFLKTNIDSKEMLINFVLLFSFQYVIFIN